MKKKNFAWVLGVLACVSAMIALHIYQVQSDGRSLDKIATISKRQPVADHMLLELERYHRLSGSFRKMTEPEISAAKSHLRERIASGVQTLDGLDPTEKETASGNQARERLSEFFVLSAKLEPTLFLRDVFAKPQARELYDQIIADVTDLSQRAASRAKNASVDVTSGEARTLQGLMVAAGLAVVLMIFQLLRTFFAYQRPLVKLRIRARELRDGKFSSPTTTRLKGIHGEIETVLDDLGLTVETQRRERQQFVTAVATDLRTPLVTLQSGAAILGSIGDRLDEHQRAQAADAVKRSLYRISRTLDDLVDITDIDRTEIRLDDKIVDLRDVLSDVARTLGAPGSAHPVQVHAPGSPVWALIDSQRLERVMINLVSKIGQYLPHGTKIDILMSRPVHGSFRGVEIVVQDGSRPTSGHASATGPEQDLLRHWVSENGFGMKLAHRVVQAHGGT
ncbi:MAG: sensor histidine kinase, partial [Bdellovibrionota bacterium]